MLSIGEFSKICKVSTKNYFNQCLENDPIHVFSVTKSIVSMLFGIALGTGCIKNLDEKVIGFFPNYQIKKGRKQYSILQSVICLQ